MSDTRKLTLPTDSNERKDVPLWRGLWKYFPAALVGVARVSKKGNDKHNPGQPIHHARGKSTDHGDCVLRHMMDVGDLEAAIERTDDHGTEAQIAALLEEVDQQTWRQLAFSQEMHERYGGAPLAPGARVPPSMPPMPRCPSLNPEDEREQCNASAGHPGAHHHTSIDSTATWEDPAPRVGRGGVKRPERGPGY